MKIYSSTSFFYPFEKNCIVVDNHITKDNDFVVLNYHHDKNSKYLKGPYTVGIWKIKN